MMQLAAGSSAGQDNESFAFPDHAPGGNWHGSWVTDFDTANLPYDNGCTMLGRLTCGRFTMKTVKTEIPENLYNVSVALAEEGWFRDEKEVFAEAIRRYLESHQPEMMERFIREDVEWGLHGAD